VNCIKRLKVGPGLKLTWSEYDVRLELDDSGETTTTTAESRYFPFQILASPSDTLELAVGWRSFRVRAGKVDGVDVTGTDGSNSNPDDTEDVPAPGYDTSTPIDFVVPSGTAVFYVWIDNTDPTAPAIATGAEAPSAGWGSSYILVALIDTATSAASLTAIVRQITRADVVIDAGGGGGAQHCKITAISDLYLSVVTYYKDANGTMHAGATAFNVAKLLPMRVAWKTIATTQTILGVTYTYSTISGADSNNYRNSSDGTNTQIEEVYPPYQVGDEIDVDSADHTGVFVSSIELTQIEKDARVWARKYVQ
jgi:hypothetical protein